MNEPDKFALVPQKPGALEQIEPGARRIVSGMVADALTLARVGSTLEQWCLLGESYHFGIGKPADATEAVNWFRMAAEKGHPRALCWLGYCYHRASGVREDMIEGVQWLQAAANRGNIVAQFNLALCFEHGLGVAPDRNQMIHWYGTAAKRGHLGAQFRLGVSNADTDAGIKWLERAAEKGHIKSQLELGLLYSLTEANVAKAVKWYRKAAESGSAEAQAALGQCFEQGRGVKQDDMEAVRWYRVAAQNGGKYGPYHLGSCYARGKGVAPDRAEAAKWLRQAAERGCEEALFEIGKRYERGEGVPQNSSEADRWLRTAAECEDYPEAQRYLASRSIREGEPVEAWAYLRLAAEEGKDLSAQEELNSLRPLMTPEQIERGEERFHGLLVRHSWKDKHGLYDLETPVQPPQRPENVRLLSKRSFRIVALDDNEGPLQSLKVVLRWYLPGSFILTFNRADSALQELEREDPDLFTTDQNHSGKSVPEILRQLANRRGKYPVFVISAYETVDTLKELLRFRDQGWDIACLSKPWSPDDFRKLLDSHLNFDDPELGDQDL